MKSKKEILLQPNNLVKSKYDFTTIENKLFYKILYNAQKQSMNRPIYHAIIKVDEFKEFIKDKNICTEQNIKSMLNLFQQSILEFDYVDEKGSLRTFGSGLINTYDLNRGNNEYEITMHETLYNHITNFVRLQKDGYTPLNLDVLFRFKGAYTQRFYTLMRLWSRQNEEVEIKYSLEEIRNYLKLKADVYPEYKHFKQKVIKRALAEINSKGNMKVDIKQEIRKGRKVDEIVFSVIDLEPRKYFYKDIVNVIDNKSDENNEKFGIIEDINAENDINIPNNKKEPLKTEIKDFYIPDETLFTKGTLRSFKKDFTNVDFKDIYMEKAFDDAVMITLDRDDTETIKATSYKFFKGTLDNKILEYEKEREADIKHQQEMNLNW